MMFLARLAILLSLAPSLAAAAPGLKVTSPTKALAFTAAEFGALPHTDVTVADPHDQKPRHFSGVAVRNLLARVEAPLGEKLRGPALALAVIARAQDGYTVLFSLAEFDEAFSSRTILLADHEDGMPLGEKAAPFQLIVPGDKKGARWARMITSLEVVSVAPKP